MERRQFFRLGFEKAVKTAVEWADSAVESRAGRCFRPPYAQREMAFLLTCSRCDRCIQACPHHVLFALPLEMGPQLAATPALDLLNHGCHLCSDWPCVRACEPGALRRPVGATPEAVIPLPQLATARIDPNRCLPYRGPECGACGSVCPVPGALRWDGPRPAIVSGLCVGCGLCREACVTTPKAVELQTLRKESHDQEPSHT
ncbi:MAG: hypothetical protein HQL80_02885 [Magnetococcales bacterium]|nr:hypothetical protein [Magnetococcales bacterium]MBF0583164.1 hypothetical protein [Magnetococcales bacterium]